MSKKSEQIKQIISIGDAFGTTPKLFVDNQTKYKTMFGSFLTFLLFGVVVMACWVYGKDMHYRENPNSIFTEESTTHPEKFKINKDTMNFCFGLQDATWTHFIDETVYKVYFEQYAMFTNEKGEISVEITDLKARRCKKEDFGIAEDYFHQLAWLEDLYCIDNYDLAYIEGDFGASVFSAIQGRVMPCQNVTDTETGITTGNCKPKEEIDAMLKDNYWALYSSDSIVNPKNFEDPYEPVGRNIYGFSSGQMYKQLDFNFRNVYLEDNTGIIFDAITKRRGIQFTNTDKFIKTEPLESGQFLQFLIRFEKVKQTRIYRTYLNLAQVLANVGGILKVCMLGFMVFSTFVADQYYNVDIVNSLFKFDYEYNGKINSQEHKKQLKGKLYFSSVLNVIFGFCGRKHVKSQQKMLNYSVRKLGYHLDIKRILQKLIEIDKLKMLLLDEQQIKLFEYLPKPTINEKMCIQSEQFQKLKTLGNKAASRDFENPEEKQDPKHVNLLFEDTRTSEDKAKEAFEAYKILNFATKKGKIDRKIIEIMDVKLKKQFENKIENQIEKKEIDVSTYRKDRSSHFFNINVRNQNQSKVKLLENQDNNSMQKQNLEETECKNQLNNFQEHDFVVQDEYKMSGQVTNIDDTLYGDVFNSQDCYQQNQTPLLSPSENKNQQILQKGDLFYIPLDLQQIKTQIINNVINTQNQVQDKKDSSRNQTHYVQALKNKMNQSNSNGVSLPPPKTPKNKSGRMYQDSQNANIKSESLIINQTKSQLQGRKLSEQMQKSNFESYKQNQSNGKKDNINSERVSFAADDNNENSSDNSDQNQVKTYDQNNI